ncbi:MAG: iron ABC transporter permease, partial [Caldiserica bacterium]
VIFKIRLPRFFLAVIVGMALAGGGVIYQGVLRNPLADPYLIGSSSGSAFGFMLCYLFGLSKIPFLPNIFAFIFSIGTVLFVIKVSKRYGKVSIFNLILAGVVTSIFLSAAVILFVTLKTKEAYSVLFWLMGDLGEMDLRLIITSGFLIFISLILLYKKTLKLNAISLGEEHAYYFGVDIEKLKMELFIISSILVSSCVSVSGTIGFVGLIVPHFIRIKYSTDNRILFPLSVLAGGFFLPFCDFIARFISYPYEIPVGVITSIIGAPYFLFQLKRR